MESKTLEELNFIKNKIDDLEKVIKTIKESGAITIKSYEKTNEDQMIILHWGRPFCEVKFDKNAKVYSHLLKTLEDELQDLKLQFKNL